MDSKHVLFEKMNNIFKSQNSDNEFFDVCFEIDGKKIYADKFRLAAVSTTFCSMLSERWNSKNESVKITGHTYEDFKEFLTFVYSGECKLTDDNVFAMIDLAEFYHLEILKNVCDKYLSKTKFTNENIFQLLEFAHKYSMKNLKETAFTYFAKDLTILAAYDRFLSLERMIIKEFITFAQDKVRPEETFEAAYKWGERQAEVKKTDSKDESFNMNDAIKNALSELLPLIQFRKMKLQYLHRFVVSKAFMFPTFEELSDILCNCNPGVTVSVTSPNGAVLQGSLPDNDNAIEFIKTLKNSLSIMNHGNNYFYWNKTFKFPTAPSRLQKREEVEWYLIHFYGGCIGIKHRSELTENNYLLAELSGGVNVLPSIGWKIEILFEDKFGLLAFIQSLDEHQFTLKNLVNWWYWVGLYTNDKDNLQNWEWIGSANADNIPWYPNNPRKRDWDDDNVASIGSSDLQLYFDNSLPGSIEGYGICKIVLHYK